MSLEWLLLYFFVIHHCKSGLSSLHISFITAHFVHHCTLKHALQYCTQSATKFALLIQNMANCRFTNESHNSTVRLLKFNSGQMLAQNGKHYRCLVNTTQKMVIWEHHASQALHVAENCWWKIYDTAINLR